MKSTTVQAPPHNISDKLFTWLSEEGQELEDILPTGNESVEKIREVLAFAKFEMDKGLFDMEEWFEIEGQNAEDASITSPEAMRQVNCKTTVCFAGSAVLFDLKPNESMGDAGRLLNGDPSSMDYDEDAQNILGLSGSQTGVLFYLPNDYDLLAEVVGIICGDITP